VSTSAESVVREFLAGWEDPDANKLVGLFSTDAVFIEPAGTYQGSDAIKAAFENLIKLFPSITIHVKTLVADDNHVIVERLDIAQFHGHPFEMEICAAFDVDSEKRITRFRDYYDFREIEERLQRVADGSLEDLTVWHNRRKEIVENS
jgi:limonene-1,2-epoxide hydrolase